ncbi:MAG: ABC transporter permease [Tenuifilaceae bacterium]|nr:ABC transporter permease [Tenuifilaceae bacterium]
MSKRNVFLKSTIRQPIFTIFLIILLGLISFAFMGKAVEYLVVQRETNRIGGYYRAIGSLVGLSGNEMEDLSEGAALIQNSPYIAYEDRRRATSGVMKDTWNTDINGSYSWAEEMTGTFMGDMWFSGKLTTKREILKKIDEENTEVIGYTLNFMIDTVLAAYPEDLIEGRPVGFIFLNEGNEATIRAIEQMDVGQRYLMRAWKDNSFRIDPSWQNTSSTLQIRALDGEALWYLPLAQGAELDFNDPALAGIKNEIDILNENQHALYIFGSADMSAMPPMQESARMYFLTDGRWLNHQDDLNQNRVIVIQKDFADLRKLRVGDTITLTLRGLQNPYGGYITTDDRDQWRAFPRHEETFEIVGIYDYLLELGTNHTTWAYLPNSIIPANVAYPLDGVYVSMYSFVLDSSRNQDAFINENRAVLAELGMEVTFSENNGATFWAAVDPLRRSAFSGLLVFTMVLVIALALVIFLYFNQRRRDYAILRALGVPKKTANRQLLLPLILFAAVGVIAGGLPAWKYTLENTASSFSSLPTPAGVLPETTLQPAYLVAIFLIILILLLVFTWVGTGILAGRPVLEILLKTTPVGAKKPIATSPPQAPSVTPPIKQVAETSLPFKTITTYSPSESYEPLPDVTASGRAREAGAAMLRFGVRHATRAGLKTILSMLVALGFALALGWMRWSIDRNRGEVEHLYDTVVVEAEIIPANLNLTTSEGSSVIAERTVERMLESGFVQYVYKEAEAKITNLNILSNTSPPEFDPRSYSLSTTLLGIDQPEEFFATLTTRDTLQYSKGWDESLFTAAWTMEEIIQQGGIPAIFPNNLINDYELEMVGFVYLGVEAGGGNQVWLPFRIAGSYLPGPRQVNENVVKTGEEAVLIPLSALRVILDNNLYYRTAKFTLDPSKNRELSAFREEMIKMVAGPNAGRLPLQIVFWDEELRAVVEPLEKNLSLLEVLYPVTVALSVLIGIGLSLLLVLQQARETALLRMLGVSRARVQALFSSEQLLLSLLGVLLGLGLLVILRQNPGAVLTGPALMAGGLYLLGALLGALIGAVSVSNKQPLELLQVKE